LIFKPEDCLLHLAVRTILGKLETEGELPQEEVQKFHATSFSFCETTLSYLNNWTVKRFHELESQSWVTFNRTPSWVDIERT
jgi:hypothetical protein